MNCSPPSRLRFAGVCAIGRRTRLGAFVAAGLIATTVVAQDPAPVPAPAVDHRHVAPLTLPGAETLVYKQSPEGELRIHIFRPEGDVRGGPRPAFLFFFGGGWMRGTPYFAANWMQDFKRLGMVGIAADYRVKERHGTDPSKSVADARAALQWVLQHAAEFGVDPSKVVVSGSSAGGHVAMWTALRTNPWGSDPAEAPAHPPAALVLMSAAIDTSEDTGILSERFLGHGRDLSPLHHLDARMPPTFIIHGDKDNAVPYAQAVALEQRLRETGNVVELVPMPGVGHGYKGSDWRQRAPALIEVFLRRNGILPAAGK
jgi:acetyl esterase